MVGEVAKPFAELHQHFSVVFLLNLFGLSVIISIIYKEGQLNLLTVCPFHFCTFFFLLIYFVGQDFQYHMESKVEKKQPRFILNLKGNASNLSSKNIKFAAEFSWVASSGLELLLYSYFSKQPFSKVHNWFKYYFPHI